MSIRKVPFGKLDSGEAADLHILTNTSGASVEITKFWRHHLAPSTCPTARAKTSATVLGCQGRGYQAPCGYLGALIGRVGNRIADGKMHAQRQGVDLAKNEGGVTHLHGGNVGFDRKSSWDVTPIEGICEDSSGSQVHLSRRRRGLSWHAEGNG